MFHTQRGESGKGLIISASRFVLTGLSFECLFSPSVLLSSLSAVSFTEHMIYFKEAQLINPLLHGFLSLLMLIAIAVCSCDVL